MAITETIAAIATGAAASGGAGVGIIRISGPRALEIAKALFTTSRAGAAKEFAERRLIRGRITHPTTGATLDDALLAYFRAPRSFTGEDVVELHCHGGALILRNLLSAVLTLGARAADPGEFTRRAFINGKMDLAEAEALSDLVSAGTEAALRSARGRYEGELSKRINSVKDGLLSVLAHTEAELDFPEEEVEPLPGEELASAVEKAEAEIKKLLEGFTRGRALKEGLKIAITGRANVGKSSLLNLLLREERAIVTETAGTTRDLIEEVVDINGFPIRLMDSAGLRDTVDEVERIGIERARKHAATADLLLFVLDASASEVGFSADKKLLSEFGEKRRIIVANKSDLAGEAEKEALKSSFAPERAIFISTLTKEGVPALEEAISREGAGADTGLPYGELIVSARQKAALERAIEALGRVQEARERRLTLDIISGELRLSIDALGEITGETTTEDILDRIFENFCIGK